MRASTFPSARFVQGVSANIAYWRQHTAELTDDQIRLLKVDHPNLLRAVLLGLALPATQIAAAKLAVQSFPLIERGGYWQEWPAVLERALNSAAGGADLSLRFHLLNRLGQLRRLNRQLETAIHIHREAETVARRLGDRTALAEVSYSLSVDYRHRRAYQEAETHGLAALAEFTALDSIDRVTAALNTLGLIAQERDDLATAEARLRQAVALGRSVNPPTFLARTLNSLAITLQAQKKYEAARYCYLEAADLLEPTASEIDKMSVQLSLGACLFEWGQLDEAEAVFRRIILALWRQQGYAYYRAVATQSLGNVLLRQQRVDKAEAYLRHSLALWRQMGDKVMLANTLGTLAEGVARKGQPETADTYYEEAIALLATYPDSAWARKLLREFTAAREALRDSGE